MLAELDLLYFHPYAERYASKCHVEDTNAPFDDRKKIDGHQLPLMLQWLVALFDLELD